MCEETDSLEQSGLITVHLSPESSFSFRLMVDLPLPSRLPHLLPPFPTFFLPSFLPKAFGLLSTLEFNLKI